MEINNGNSFMLLGDYKFGLILINFINNVKFLDFNNSIKQELLF